MSLLSSKATLIFPGQGSQYVGMGKDLPRDYFDRAGQRLGLDLATLCREGPLEKLVLTPYTQPAILTHSVALLERVRPLLASKGISIARVMGHSVGEYAALVCAGAMSFEDAVWSTHLRGKFMQEAVPPGEGGMAAVLKLDFCTVAETCRQVDREGERVGVANFNSPEQVVISGHLKALDKVARALGEKAKGKRFRVIPLPVSAPFHGPLMALAAERLAEHFRRISFRPPELPYVANIDGREYPAGTPGDVVKQNLIRQIEGSVQWMTGTKALEENPLVFEIGPGRVLSALVKKCRPDATCYSLDGDLSPLL
ncbi:MAG: ACP S-malonyltransferase [Bacteriovoracales bacterium]|nr:ACP S-malonyltransferase [Bacteriovoracales bacterium]